MNPLTNPQLGYYFTEYIILIKTSLRLGKNRKDYLCYNVFHIIIIIDNVFRQIPKKIKKKGKAIKVVVPHWHAE